MRPNANSAFDFLPNLEFLPDEEDSIETLKEKLVRYELYLRKLEKSWRLGWYKTRILFILPDIGIGLSKFIRFDWRIYTNKKTKISLLSVAFGVFRISIWLGKWL